MKESPVQQRIRLAAPYHGCILWRNNVGACQTVDGQQIRYGLANESAQINKEFKSSDLIGIQQVVITPEMVGQVVGVFIAIEVKRESWHYTGSGREVAQEKWLNIVRSRGGYGLFATGVKDIWPG